MACTLLNLYFTVNLHLAVNFRYNRWQSLPTETPWNRQHRKQPPMNFSNRNSSSYEKHDMTFKSTCPTAILNKKNWMLKFILQTDDRSMQNGVLKTNSPAISLFNFIKTSKYLCNIHHSSCKHDTIITREKCIEWTE